MISSDNMLPNPEQKHSILSNKNHLIIFIFLIAFLAFFLNHGSAFAIPTIALDQPTYFYNDGAIGSFEIPTITVTDLSASGTVTVHVKSSTDNTGINLVLTETAPGSHTFANTNLVFLRGNYFFPIGRTITVTINDPTLVTTPGVVETTNHAAVLSTTDNAGINPLILTETGPGTGIFKGKVLLSPSTTNTNSIHVNHGDVLSVFYLDSGLISNAMIGSTSGVGAIRANFGDTITVSYPGAVDATATIGLDPPGGGGSGGLITPGLVLDAILTTTIQGGTSAERSYPKMHFDKTLISTLPLPPNAMDSITHPEPFKPISPISNPKMDLPLVIGNNGYAIQLYTNTLVTDTEETDKIIPLKLTLYNSFDMTHVGIYVNIRGDSGNIQDSDTYVEWDKDKPLKIVDPNNLFSNVTFAENKNGVKYKFLYNFTFAKPMPKSDIVIRAWNSYHASSDTRILNAWQIISSSNKTTSSNALINDTIDLPLNNSQNNSQTINDSLTSNLISNNNDSDQDFMTMVKKWSGYSSTSISDSEFLKYLNVNATYIPHWFMKNTGLLLTNQTDEQDFHNAIDYLYKIHIIK